jgi:molybdopterin synthase catalytic subunit
VEQLPLPFERLGDAHVKSTARTELRSADANAGAVAQFVALVKDIDDGESTLQLADDGQVEAATPLPPQRV